MAFSALLLAGGRSTRMGQDKAWLPWPQRPLWEAQLEKLRSLQPAELLVSARPEQRITGPDFRVIHDARPDCGPLAGLAAALQTMNSAWLVVLAVDLPYLDAAFFSKMISLASQSGKGQIPHTAQGFEPLAAVYPRSIAPFVQAQLSTANLSLRAVIEAGIFGDLLETNLVSAEEFALFRNLNAPGDLPA